MNALELVVLCSSMPGFIRSIGGRLAGKCRLLECYSLHEVSQVTALHQPSVLVVDLTRGDQGQIDRTWAVAQNLRSSSVVVVATGQISEADVPEELLRRVTLVTVDDQSDYSSQVCELATALLNGDCSSTIGATSAAENGIEQTPSKGVASGQDRVSGMASVRASSLQQQSASDDMQKPVNTDHGVSSGSTEQNQSIADRYRTQTPALRQMLQRLEVAARHNVTILLIGETGSGKTHLARLIHEVSPRSGSPFLTVACGALPAELIESELFGHVKGAFTSAHADKDGKFLAAGNGSILLDEIDVLTPEQQVKLLRVIEKGEFEPVGSNNTLNVQARIIAASNLELQPLVEEGRFRPDLYYRLNTLCFQIPPLRKRLPDIEPLARYFVHLHAEKHGIEVVEISADFIDVLIRYPWPGNVREMENAIRSAVLYSEGGCLTAETLPPNIIDCAAGPANDPSVASFFGSRKAESLGNRIEFTERDIIEQALLNNSFSRTRTARELGISRVTLYNKMKKYGMMPEKH